MEWYFVERMSKFIFIHLKRFEFFWAVVEWTPKTLSYHYTAWRHNPEELESSLP
jgi:hypothetical protein